MRKVVFVVAISLLPAMAQSTHHLTAEVTTTEVTGSMPNVRCFFQNGVTNGGQNNYWGNSVTHDNTYMPTSQVMTMYQHYGNNAMIFDGPVVHIGTSCLLTSVTYLSGPGPDTDPYQQHFICVGNVGTGTYWQGATVTTTTPATAGPCTTGDTPTGYTNTYDVGLYCVSNTSGECTYGQLYCNVGPVAYNVAYPAANLNVTFNCNQGSVALPVGDYAVMMGTNCDSGSVAAPGGAGTDGSGGVKCITGHGEGANFGGGGSQGAYSNTTELYAWKYFVFSNNNGSAPFDGHCLLYDPKHDNTIGVPPTLTAYDPPLAKGCSLVDGDSVELSPSGQAPHTLGFTWWSNI